LAAAVAVAVTVVAAPANAAGGDVDPAFGAGGQLTTDFGGTYDWAYATAVQPDGRILAAGVSDARGTYDFALARYTAAGLLDESFGDHGVVITDFGRSSDWVYAIVLQPDGRIVLGGSSNTGGGVGRIFGADNLALARYLPNGLLDPGFGDTGKVVVDAGSLFESIRALALDPAGRLVAAGRTSGERRGDLLVARFLPDGAPDASFGTSRPGLTVTDLGTAEEGLTGLALAPDGTIVTGGIVAPHPHGDLAVMRYDTAGRFDRSFAHDGLATVDIGGRDDRARALALQPDGNAVVVGYSETDFVVARFTAPAGPRR
jgi:uncharacterized delta-60 repeat protein